MGQSAYLDSRLKHSPLVTQEQIDKDKTGNSFTRLILYTEMQQRDYLLRPIWQMDLAPGFDLIGKVGRRTAGSDAVISLPLYSKFSRLRVDQIPMQKLLIRLKQPDNLELIKFFKEAIQNNLDKHGLKDLYEIWSYMDTVENSKDVSKPPFSILYR